MPKYGKKSKSRLATCHPDIQKVFNEVIKYWDCSILEGRRSKERQNMLYNSKPQRSKLQWPKSRHNVLNPTDLSNAIDSVPFPIDWPDEKHDPKNYVKDMGRLYSFVGFVQGIAQQMGIKLRVGADWDGDHDFLDQSFDDLPHFELVG